MGRLPCCERESVKRGQWTPEEDNRLASYIAQHGTRNWRLIPKNAGLQRCGKSCRLRWTNYLRPDLKRDDFSESEEETIIRLHSVVGNRWSLIAGQLPGRTDNDVKNYWNTKLKKKLSGMGIDPVTHKPFSHLMAEIATTLHQPQVAHLAEAALGCFKDEMLHLLTKKRTDFTAPPATQTQTSMSYTPPPPPPPPPLSSIDDNEETIEKIKQGLSRAILQKTNAEKPWAAPAMAGSNSHAADDLADLCEYSAMVADGFQYGGGEPEWSMQSLSTTTEQQQRRKLHTATGHDDDKGVLAECARDSRKDDTAMFNSDYVFWDLSDDLMNSIL